MSADFEKDEIQDSPFPVEFNDDSVPIDMYGVWVKSGPRDAAMPEETESLSRVVSSTTDSELPVPPDEYPDLPDLPDLDVEETSAFVPESDFTSIPDISESNISAQDLTVDDESLPVIEFDEVVNDSFASQSTGFDNISESEPKIDVDEFTEIPAVPSHSLDDTANIDLDDFLLTEEIRQDETFEEVISDKTQELCAPVTSFEEITADDFMEQAPEIQEMQEMPELPVPAAEEPAIASSEESLAEPPVFENDVSFEIDSIDEIDKSLPSDDDFSSFLDDLNSGSIPDSAAIDSVPIVSNGTSPDDLDLDAFINSVNETGAPSRETAEKVFDDQEPLNIDLEFDESFIEDVEKIRATGASVSEAEFENSEFGVEMIDETALPESDDFDAFLATSTERTIDAAKSAPETASPPAEVESLEVTNEFDDLLDSLQLTPAPATAQSSSSSFTQRARTFNLSVTEEDENDTIATTVTNSSIDDDFDVSLLSAQPRSSKAVTQEQPSREPVLEVFPEPVPEPAADEFELTPEVNMSLPEEENLDIPEIKDYNITESDQSIDSSVSPLEETVSPDFDDISAVENELNDFVPEAGEEKVVTNDKSTELLMLIANELSSIKNEITTLKSEFAGYKTSTAENPSEIHESEIPSQKENSGFFSDDDTDETIALTGDELNNILITADFTEEKNLEDESVAPSMDTAETGMKDIDIDVASPQFNADSIEDIPDTLPDSILDVPSFEAPLPPVEAVHLTTVEDESGYLEGSDIAEPDLDNVAIEEPDLEIIDFEDEKLEEPELTEFNLDLSSIESEFPAEQEVAKSTESDGTTPVVDFSLPEAEAIVPENSVESVGEETFVPVVTVGDSLQTVEPEETPVTSKTASDVAALPVELKDEIKSVLAYMDQLLENLPEDKIEEFARSEHFEVYKKLFEELGIS
jgi:hypothetical protein